VRVAVAAGTAGCSRFSGRSKKTDAAVLQPTIDTIAMAATARVSLPHAMVRNYRSPCDAASTDVRASMRGVAVTAHPYARRLRKGHFR
jgi:hypothetical protein